MAAAMRKAFGEVKEEGRDEVKEEVKDEVEKKVKEGHEWSWEQQPKWAAEWLEHRRPSSWWTTSSQ